MYYVSPLIEKTEAKTYTSQGGVVIRRDIQPVPLEIITQDLPHRLNNEKGAIFSSSFEYTGRYTRWDVGFIKPPLEITTKGHDFCINALNARGSILLKVLKPSLAQLEQVTHLNICADQISGVIRSGDQEIVDESERTKQSSVFDILRLIQSLFYSQEDSFLGLYGAFGFDLIYQFEDIPLAKPREKDQRDLHLYLPDEIYVVDRKQSESYCIQYDFIFDGESTRDFPQSTGSSKTTVDDVNSVEEWHYPEGYYADLVRQALPSFTKGDLFEVVPSQVIQKQTVLTPSEVYQNLKEQNPSPYGFMIHFGVEHLIGASPEMYVRVDGRQVETCPISGTIRRGETPLEDAENIRTLLNSRKDEAELTMCTDVDRNDKSRICVPGSVKVIGRRQIEMYSKLFHTVDHIVGELRPEFDGIDAFITHMWAVTVTGAPKLAAVRWIEIHEDTPREWYGGAVGWIAFNGNINTGLTLRTAKIQGHSASMRVGATLLHASNPMEEEQETLVKVKALSLALEPNSTQRHSDQKTYLPGSGRHILLIDHEDSFVHTLANYFRQTGAKVKIMRALQARKALRERCSYDLVVLSPGPSRPDDFGMKVSIDLCLKHGIPIFGVCLGFQGIAEYFGGKLGVLPQPCHGESSEIDILKASPLFEGVGSDYIKIGRYHSLYVETMPKDLDMLAMSKEGIPMAFKHLDLPIYGVQFHPESILSDHQSQGYQIICNLMETLA